MKWDKEAVAFNCDTLLGYPEDMRNAEEFAMEHKRAIEDLEARNAEIYNEIAFDVTSELNDAGKPMFSNQEKRDLETKRRLSERKDYHEREREIAGHKVQQQEGWTRKHTLKEEMQNLRVIIQAQLTNMQVEMFGNPKLKEIWNGSE